jgi:outer membrane autotransporter protein
MSDFSFNPTWIRTSPAKLAGVRGAVAALGLMLVALTSPSHAQAPPLGTAASYGVLAGTTVTNVPTSFSVINGDLGVFSGNACTGFDHTNAGNTCSTLPLGGGHVTGAMNAGNAAALQAQSDFFNAYGILAGRPATANLTGTDLGGLTLVPGVYFFSSSAQLTGLLRLNGLGNPNSVFIFNIVSGLNTASGSTVSLINNAQGGNVFWRVGSTASLGTTTTFVGDILALTSITLAGGDTINCGAAWAHTAEVTLNGAASTITTCAPGSGGGTGVGPTGLPLFASLLPPSANNSQRAVANALDTFTINGGTLPLGFVNLFNLSPSQLADAFAQLQGEAGTGAAQAGTQAMNSFLSLLTNPFENNRPFAPAETRPQMPVKALGYGPESPQSPARSAFASLDGAPFVGGRRWGIWAAAYGGQSNTTGDSLAGSHDRSARTFGYATGLDYRVTPYTVVGFALAGGGTNFGLSGGFGSGHSDMFQAAVYSLTRVNAAYVSAALAYGWHRVSTDRFVTVAGTDHLTADFSANSFGGRIEGGYRFAIPGVLDSSGFGLTPYAALQAQSFRTPSYSEIAASGSSTFALAYNARTTTTTRTELGSWVDKSYALDRDSVLSLFARAAWAHDWYSDPSVTATFLALPGSSFTEFGAPPAHNSLLASAGAQLYMRNGWSVMAKLDTETAQRSHTYIGTARLRYTW